MSMRGYKKKGKAALWTTTYPDQVRVVPEKKKRHHGMSIKRRKESAEYSKLRVAFLTAHPLCERPGCGRPAECVHHWAGRRSNYLRQETWRASCIVCNDWAKNDPKGARLVKWIAPVGEYLC